MAWWNFPVRYVICKRLPGRVNDDLMDEFGPKILAEHGMKIVNLVLKEARFFPYPLVNVYIAMERSTILNGKIHDFYGHFQ